MIDADVLERSFVATRTIVAGIKPDQLGDATPCTEWTVRDVLNHVIGTTQMFTARARGESSDWDPFGHPSNVGGDDVVATYNTATSDAVSAWRKRGTDGVVTLNVGDVPAEVALNIQFTDNLVHSWDIARATGQSFTVPEDLVAVAWEFLDGNLAEGSRGEGKNFAAPVEVPADSPVLDRLIAYAGRQPLT
jgi:uncharacterized protein (TIGR03086 family)